MSVGLTTLEKSYFTTPLNTGKYPPISTIEMSKFYENNPKFLVRVIAQDYGEESSIITELMAKGNEFRFETDQVIWEEELNTYNNNIVSGAGVVAFDGTNKFTITSHALQTDIYDINSDKPTTAQWLNVKPQMEFTAYDASGHLVYGKITALSEDKTNFTATGKGGSDLTELDSTNITIIFTGNNLDHCQLAPCVGYFPYAKVKENTMFKDSECVEFCKETEISNGVGGDAEPLYIGTDAYNVSHKIDNALKGLWQRTENAFVFNKRLSVAEANGGERGTEGVFPTIEAQSTRFQGYIETEADLVNLSTNCKLRKIKMATLRVNSVQETKLLQLARSLDFHYEETPYKDPSQSIFYIGLSRINVFGVVFEFKRWDILDLYPDIAARINWLMIPEGKVNVRFGKKGNYGQAGYLNIGWFGTANDVYKNKRVDMKPENPEDVKLNYVNKFMVIPLRVQDWMYGYNVPA